jgi:hypothetical protein
VANPGRLRQHTALSFTTSVDASSEVVAIGRAMRLYVAGAQSAGQLGARRGARAGCAGGATNDETEAGGSVQPWARNALGCELLLYTANSTWQSLFVTFKPPEIAKIEFSHPTAAEAH